MKVLRKKIAEVSKETQDNLSTGVEVFTPKRAADALLNMIENRSSRDRIIAKYANAMRTGQWTLGQPISFDSDGRLIDGQHRLLAVVKCGIPCAFVVVRGLLPETVMHFDQGKPRSASDVLKMRGEKHVVTLASVSRIVEAMARGMRDPGGMSNFDPPLTVDDIVHRATSDDLLKAVVADVVGSFKPVAKMIRSAGLAGWFIYCGSAGLTEHATEFDDFLSIVMGKRPGSSERDPAHVLRNRLLKEEWATGKTPPYVRLGLVVKAWNHFLGSREITQVFFRTVGSNAERFPVMKLDIFVPEAGKTGRP